MNSPSVGPLRSDKVTRGNPRNVCNGSNCDVGISPETGLSVLALELTSPMSLWGGERTFVLNRYQQAEDAEARDG